MALNDYLFQGAALRRQRGAVRGSAQQLPERGPRSAHRHSDHARPAVHGSGAPRGLDVEGVNFPGHFLLRCPARRGLPYSEDLIIDAFHGGALLSEDALRERFRRHAGDDAVFEPNLLAHATKPQILARMLLNLKRLRPHALLPAGARHHGADARRRSVGHQRAPRPRPARLPPEGLLGRAARSAGVSAALDDDDARRGRARGARADLGARQDAAQAVASPN